MSKITAGPWVTVKEDGIWKIYGQSFDGSCSVCVADNLWEEDARAICEWRNGLVEERDSRIKELEGKLRIG